MRAQLEIVEKLVLTNHHRLVMVLRVTPANTNHVFRALADPTRRAIFEELTRQGEQTVHALTLFAGVSQPAVSKHLAVLKSRPRTRDVYGALARTAMRALPVKNRNALKKLLRA